MNLVATNVHIKSKYCDDVCDVYTGSYPDGSSCFILLRDSKTGEDVSQPTACIPFVNLSKQPVVLVKDYSENEGMLKALQEAGIISQPRESIPSCFIDLHICDLLKTEAIPE